MCANTFTEQVFEPEQLASEQNGHRVEVEVLSRLGANLASFKVDGRELIYFDKDRLIEDPAFYSGCFMMFPTPCRLTDAKYSFGGTEIHQTKGGQVVSIHGLIRDERFSVSRGANSLTCRIDIDKGHPVYEGYPFCCSFSLDFALLERGLQITFSYENKDSKDAPFGFGLHPFWRILAERKDVFIQVPCDQTLELVKLIPTGNTESVEGTNLDIRKFRSLRGLFIDNAFWHRDPGGEQAIEYRDLGEKLTLESSDIFEHMIAYSPEGEPFVCMENLTCCPDAPNVYAKGNKEVSGLQVVGPGQSLSGWVKYVVSDL